MWQNLSLEVKQEFANPYWLAISLRAIRSSNGVFLNPKIVTGRSDEQFADDVRELLPTRYTWTSRELSDAAGDPTPGGARICGRLLATTPGWHQLEAGGLEKWTNPDMLLQWFASREFVSLRDAGKHLGVAPKVLAPLLRGAGWVETRNGTKRVWTRSCGAEVRRVG